MSKSWQERPDKYCAAETPKHRAKKNTRKWCKGKVGKEHAPRWGRSQQLGWIRNPEDWTLVYACQNCGKHLDFYVPWWREKEPAPVVGSTQPRVRR